MNTSWRRTFLVPRKCCSSQFSAKFSALFFPLTKKCNVDLQHKFVRMSCSQVARPSAKDVERITNVLSALATSTMRSKWLLRFGMVGRQASATVTSSVVVMKVACHLSQSS